MEDNGMEFGSQSITPALNLVAMVLSMFLCLLPLKHISEVFAPKFDAQAIIKESLHKTLRASNDLNLDFAAHLVRAKEFGSCKSKVQNPVKQLGCAQKDEQLIGRVVQLSILPFQLFESPILSNHSWNTASQFPNDMKTSQVGIDFFPTFWLAPSTKTIQQLW